VNALASSVNADEIAEMLGPLIGTDEEARRVAKHDRQEVRGRVEPQLAHPRHIYITRTVTD